jgi:hypothetical protein
MNDNYGVKRDKESKKIKGKPPVLYSKFVQRA